MLESIGRDTFPQKLIASLGSETEEDGGESETFRARHSCPVPLSKRIKRRFCGGSDLFVFVLAGLLSFVCCSFAPCDAIARAGTRSPCCQFLFGELTKGAYRPRPTPPPPAWSGIHEGTFPLLGGGGGGGGTINTYSPFSFFCVRYDGCFD